MPFSFFPSSLSGAYRIEPKIFADERGYFLETYAQSDFSKYGIDRPFVQENHSFSKKGVLRGLHFQSRFPQAKLIRVLGGTVYDVIVDLRVDSPTFGQWEGVILNAEKHTELYIPRGCAHGFLALSDTVEFLYQCDAEYDPSDHSGIRYDDPTLSIPWRDVGSEYGIHDFLLSEKDELLPSFEIYMEYPIF